MRGTLRVAGREMRERWMVLAVAVLLGLLALAAPLLPQFAHTAPGEASAAVATILGLLLTAVLALALGGSVVAADLASGRIGFYLAQPLSAGAVWSGKILAAALLPLLAGGLVLAPAALLAGVGGRTAFLRPAWRSEELGTLTLFGLLCGLVALAQAVGVAARSRSRWLLLDVLVVALGGFALAATLERLEMYEASATRAALLALAPVAVGVALLATGGFAFARGRALLLPVHRAAARGLAALALPAVLAAWGLTSWILAAPPGELVSATLVESAPAGSWITVAGPVHRGAGDRHAFLLNTDDGRWLRLGRGWHSIGGWPMQPRIGPLFAPGGDHAAWVDDGSDGTHRLITVDLRASAPRAQPTTVSYASDPHWIALSADGQRVAAVVGDRLILDDVARGATLGAWPVSGQLLALRFELDGSVLAATLQPAVPRRDPFERYVAHRFRAGQPIEVVEGPALERHAGRSLVVGPDRLLLPGTGAPGAEPVRIVGIEQADIIATVQADAPSREASFLADGGLVWIDGEAGALAAQLVHAAGGSPLAVPLDDAVAAVLGGEMVPGQVVVGILNRQGVWSSSTLDAAAGSLRPLAAGLLPAIGGAEAGPPGSVGSRLFHDAMRPGRLVLLDPAGGVERDVLPGTVAAPQSHEVPWWMREAERVERRAIPLVD